MKHSHSIFGSDRTIEYLGMEELSKLQGKLCSTNYIVQSSQVTAKYSLQS